MRGPRTCLGRKCRFVFYCACVEAPPATCADDDDPGDLVMNEMGYILARLVQKFEKLDRIDDDPWVENIAMATTSANGAKVTVFMDRTEEEEE